MKKAKASKKQNPKKAKATASKKVTAKAKAATKKKPAPEAKARAQKKVRPVAATVEAGNQNVETVRMKPRRMTARAGAGGGDFGGTSIVEDVNSESPDELLEEGQAFEAGIVRGVEEADTEIEQEVRTHQEPQDDVPEEYKENDRP
jgi:hypothetical protein